MQIHLSITAATLLLVACGKADPVPQGQQAGAAPEFAPATATSIDDTPVEALAIGGSLLVLQAGPELSAPQHSGWRDAQEYRLELTLAPPVHQSIKLRHDAASPAIPVFLRAASDGHSLFLRMRWADDSENSFSERTTFADAAAVQFALGDAASTSFMMGAPAGPVNIWYWRAGVEAAQNLTAGGFGSTTPLDTAGLHAESTYRPDGEWVVVFSRALAAQGEHQVQLQRGSASVAFALWQGEQQQRDGLKHVSMGWVSLEPAS